MKIVRLMTLAGMVVAGAGFLAVAAKAQGPLYDKVIVDLPYTVTVNNVTLQPGHYVIRQFQDASGDSRILQIFGPTGQKLEATALTIPTLDINTPEKTRVILHHYGNDYYFDKIWVQGKNYGYEFPLPPSVKAREKERVEPYTVAAQYQGASQPEVPETKEIAIAPEPAPAPAPAAEPAPVEPAPAPAPALAPETNAMPTTASNWGLEVAGGFVLALAGLMLRRRTA
jgi:hypothetical protein